jgi:hypothetical protein
MRKIAYILAASHSGSTLLAMLLGAHPEICTVGELKLNKLGNIDDYRCSCGKPITKCNFWVEISSKMRKKGIPFRLDAAGTNIGHIKNRYIYNLIKPLHRGVILEAIRDAALFLSPVWHHHLREVQKRNSALITTLQEVSGAKVIIDSSKIGVRLKYLLRNTDLDVFVIRLVRDGRGVALTYMDPSNFADASDPALRNGGRGNSINSEYPSIAQAAYEWRRNNEEAEFSVKRLDKSRLIRVRYEQLCQDPDQTLNKICEFLNVSKYDTKQGFRSIQQHVVGNGMRLNASSEIQLDERWKTTLTKENLRIFNSIAGEINRKYGYQ